jgi:hypothetical protein
MNPSVTAYELFLLRLRSIVNIHPSLYARATRNVCATL